METYIAIIDFLILGLIMATPILLLVYFKKSNTKHSCIYYFLIGLLVSSGIICCFAWWTDKSNLILLEHYGYTFHVNTTKSYENVLPENIERVKNMETSIMGVGWPLKAILGFIVFIPYLLLVYIGNKLLKKIKNEKSED